MIDEKYNELAFYTLGLQDECFIHQYIVDAFTAQTANEDTKPISLAFALVGLYLYIEKNYSGKDVQKFHTKMSKVKINWPIFILPQNRGEINTESVLNVQPGEDRNIMIKAWCNAVWRAFYENHGKVLTLVEYYLNQKY